MKIFLASATTLFLVGLALIIWFLTQLIFISTISKTKVKLMKPVSFLENGYRAIRSTQMDVSTSPSIMATDDPNPHYGPAILTQDGLIKDYKVDADFSFDRPVYILNSNEKQFSRIFLNNQIYAIDDNRVGELIHVFRDIDISRISYALPLTNDSFLLATVSSGGKHSLWQISHHDFTHKLLTDNLSYSIKQPKIFKSEPLQQIILVYYSGDVTFAYGGDTSRPKYSTIRLFDNAHPSGIDIARLSLNAGVVVDIEVDKHAIIAYCDPNLPNSKSPLPWNVWRIEPVKNYYFLTHGKTIEQS